MDPAAAVAIGLVALAVVLGGAAWRRRRGGIAIDLRIWWDDRQGEPPSDE